MPAISIITGSIWKAAKVMETEQISHCSGPPSQVRAKAHLWPLQGKLQCSCHTIYPLTSTTGSEKFCLPQNMGSWHMKCQICLTEIILFDMCRRTISAPHNCGCVRIRSLRCLSCYWCGPELPPPVILVYTLKPFFDKHECKSTQIPGRFCDVLLGICNVLGQMLQFSLTYIKNI